MGNERLSIEQDSQQFFNQLHADCKQYLQWASSAGYSSFKGKFYINMAKQRENALVDLVQSSLEKINLGKVKFDLVEQSYRQAHPFARRIDLIDEILSRIQYCPFPKTTFEQKLFFGVDSLLKYSPHPPSEDSSDNNYVSN